MCLIPIFYFLSGNELAPQEDQGVIFGAIQAAPNSTIDQTVRYTEKMREVYQSFPETDHSFQLTFPAGDAAGFSGMVAKPYSERKRSTIEIYPEVAGEDQRDPRHRRVHDPALAAAGREQFPGGVRDRLDGRPARAARFRQTDPGKGDDERSCSPFRCWI